MTTEILNGLGKRKKVFPPVGSCIYCGEREGTLGEEHIIPFGLGGNLILPKASCPKCSDITGRQVEGEVLNAHWGTYSSPRLRLNLPTRKPKKRPEQRTIKITDANGETRTVTVKASEAPLAFLGFTTEHARPGVLRGAEPSDRFTGSIWLKYDTDDVHKLAKPGENFDGVGRFSPLTYGRMICKIAHSLAVAEYGLDSFAPYLPDLILGKSNHLMQYVSAQASPEPDNHGLHNLHIGWLEKATPAYLVAYVRLFCSFGTPDYMVVVGRRRPDPAGPA